MADPKRISELPTVPNGTTFDGTEVVVFNKGGTTYRGTLAGLIANQLSIGVQSVVSSATITPTFSNDLVKVTALAVNATIANPTGTAKDGWGIVIRIKDDGTQRTLAYGTQFRAGADVTLPTTTTVGKWTYLNAVFNAEDTKWDVLSVGVSG